MSEIEWFGGTAADHDRVAALHHAYLVANASFDWETLQSIWSGAPDATFFNMNGHTYNGRAHWTRLWQFYKTRMKTGEWVPFDMRGVMAGDLATVWCHRRTHLEWVGEEPKPARDTLDVREFISRSTMIFRREEGDWRVVHVHFSEGSAAPRPGAV